MKSANWKGAWAQELQRWFCLRKPHHLLSTKGACYKPCAPGECSGPREGEGRRTLPLCCPTCQSQVWGIFFCTRPHWGTQRRQPCQRCHGPGLYRALSPHPQAACVHLHMTLVFRLCGMNVRALLHRPERSRLLCASSLNTERYGWAWLRGRFLLCRTRVWALTPGK